MSNFSPLVDEGYDRALELLLIGHNESGFVASTDFPHYNVLWARDAAITSLGAVATGDKSLLGAAKRTLVTLASGQSVLGQIPAVVRDGGRSWDWGEGGAVDVTAWYVILSNAVIGALGDMRFARSIWPSITSSINWLRHQDVTGTGLISGAPSTDWMDSSLTKSGRTLQLNVLYYWASLAAKRISSMLGVASPVDPEDIKWRVNLLFWPTAGESPASLLVGHGMPLVPKEFPHGATEEAFAEAATRPRGHYVSHVIHSLFDENCDVLANVLAVCAGLAGTTCEYDTHES